MSSNPLCLFDIYYLFFTIIIIPLKFFWSMIAASLCKSNLAKFAYSPFKSQTLIDSFYRWTSNSIFVWLTNNMHLKLTHTDFSINISLTLLLVAPLWYSYLRNSGFYRRRSNVLWRFIYLISKFFHYVLKSAPSIDRRLDDIWINGRTDTVICPNRT